MGPRLFRILPQSHIYFLTRSIRFEQNSYYIVCERETLNFLSLQINITLRLSSCRQVGVFRYMQYMTIKITKSDAFIQGFSLMLISTSRKSSICQQLHQEREKRSEDSSKILSNGIFQSKWFMNKSARQMICSYTQIVQKRKEIKIMWRLE